MTELIDNQDIIYWVCPKCGNTYRPDDFAFGISLLEVVSGGTKLIEGVSGICIDCVREILDESESLTIDEIKE